ncbi:hypothetical protein [Nocardia sp. NPDC052566]|uniref:hypothetical protein n=1 Tax=Nocardia sp. NPDC052566 TaxID=3364330 RepID=UPI0037CAF32C
MASTWRAKVWLYRRILARFPDEFQRGSSGFRPWHAGESQRDTYRPKALRRRIRTDGASIRGGRIMVYDKDIGAILALRKL